MVVGTGIIVLRITQARSLKEKRAILRKILKRTQNEFNISIAEIGDQDMWGRAQIGFSLVGNDRRLVDAKADHVLKFIESMDLAEILFSDLEIMNISRKIDLNSMEMLDKYEPPDA